MKSTDTRQVEKERKPVHRLTPFTLAALGSQKRISKIRSLLSLERANQAARACNTEGFLSWSFRVPFQAEVISRHGSKLFPFWKMLNPSGGGTYHVCLSVAVKGHFTNGAAIGI
jgi:hypothetical protein